MTDEELKTAHANAVRDINNILRHTFYGRIHDPVPIDQLAMEYALYSREEHVDRDVLFNMRQRMLSRCGHEFTEQHIKDAENTLRIMGVIP